MSAAPGTRPERESATLPGLVVGCAAGLATLEIPIVGWFVVVAFLAGAARACRLSASVAPLLLGVGVTWISLLVSSGVTSELVGWFTVGIGLLIAGLVGLGSEGFRRSR